MTKGTQPNMTAYRFQSDARQFGGLLMLMSFCCVIMPLAGIAEGFGPTGAASTDPSTPPLWGLIAGICVFTFGVTGLITGYMAAVHDWSHKYLNIFLMVIIQTAWIGYITDMVAVSQASQATPEDNGFIPLEYEPTSTDVRFVGAMGVIAIMIYGFGFVGSVAFMVWSLHTYTTNNASDRSGSYFKGRMMTYSVFLAIGGLVQFLLGCWCSARFEVNTAEFGPVAVAFLIVSFPGISVYVGLLQLMNGVWGIARSMGIGLMENTSIPVFQLSIAFQWLSVIVLQNLVQIAYLPGGNAAAVVPFLACFSLGLNLMPAFLDHKSNTVPDTLPDDYYGEMMQSVKDVEQDV